MHENFSQYESNLTRVKIVWDIDFCSLGFIFIQSLKILASIAQKTVDDLSSFEIEAKLRLGEQEISKPAIVQLFLFFSHSVCVWEHVSLCTYMRKFRSKKSTDCNLWNLKMVRYQHFGLWFSKVIKVVKKVTDCWVMQVSLRSNLLHAVMVSFSSLNCDVLNRFRQSPYSKSINIYIGDCLKPFRKSPYLRHTSTST